MIGRESGAAAFGEAGVFDEAAFDGAATSETAPAAESPEAAETAEPPEDSGASGSEESARALAEHNALARVFDDVRSQSRAGNLVAPTRWEDIGLVPDHMAAEEFEMFVYDYWAGEHPGEGLDADPLGTEQTRAAERARTADAASSIPRTSTASSSAVRGVGVPPFLRAKEGADPVPSAAELEPAEAARADGAGSPPGAAARGAAAEDGGRAAEPVPDDEPAGDGGADDNPFAGLNLPEGYKLVQVEGEWVLVPDEDAEPVELPIDCKDIAALIGRYSYYLYDRTLMTDAYAHWAFLAAEDDDTVTFVDCVREESRTYPRPMPVESLENEPFGFSRARIMDIWDGVRESGDYPDIRQTSASNGDVFFYSTRYLDPEYARSLAEWAAVERLRNV